MSDWLPLDAIFDATWLDPPAAEAFELLRSRGVVKVDSQQLSLQAQKVLHDSSHADDLPPPRRHAARALHTLLASLFPPHAASASCAGQSSPASSTALVSRQNCGAAGGALSLADVDVSPAVLYAKLEVALRTHRTQGCGASALLGSLRA